jgi:uncharacterized protein YrrD
MLRSIKELYGDKLGATDGEIGHVKDCYFDDKSWVVRYLIADTGHWLPGRLVLIAPRALRDFNADGDQLLVNLSRKQIEESPAIAAHKPVSRQYEDEYYSYYQWAPYWTGNGLFGGGGFPIYPEPAPVPIARRTSRSHDEEDPHLRSTRAVSGYEIHTSEGAIGHVSDFIVHDGTWVICHLIVATGPWLLRKEIAIAPRHITRISYEESKVFVDVSSEAIRTAPEYDVPAWGYQDTAKIDR